MFLTGRFERVVAAVEAQVQHADHHEEQEGQPDNREGHQVVLAVVLLVGVTSGVVPSPKWSAENKTYVA